MYPKNFIDYKLYLRRLSLPQFVIEWFGNKNVCLNKISREALKNNLDINELLLNVIFQIIQMLHIDKEESDKIIGHIISRILEVQQSFESFKYYKYGLEDYNKRKDTLESQYKELLDKYQQEMQQIVIEREEYSKIKLELEKIKEENLLLVQENIQLKEENKNIHDSFDKDKKITTERIEQQEEEILNLRKSLIDISSEKDKVQLLLINSEESKNSDLAQLVEKFQSDFDKLRFEKESLRKENVELVSQIQDLSRKRNNDNDGLSTQFDYYINRDNLQATKSILSLALEEIQRISRDGNYTRQLIRHIEKEKYSVKYFSLIKHLTNAQQQEIKKENKDKSSNSFNNSSSYNYSNSSSQYVDEFNSSFHSFSSNSNSNNNYNNNQQNKSSKKSFNGKKKTDRNLSLKEWNALNADRR